MNGNQIVTRFNQLVSARSQLDSVLEDIETFCVPYRGEFYGQNVSETEVDWRKGDLFDSTAVDGVNQLASQMHGNLTSSVTKWFSLRFRDEDLNTDTEAKEWLEDVEDRAWQALQESNFDTAAPEMYMDISSFGTSIMTIEDVDDLVWDGVEFNALPIMDSYFESGPDDKPYRTYRLLRYTQMELEDSFDLPEGLLSKDVEETDVDAREEVIFCIYKEKKNRDADLTKILAPELRPVQYRYVHKQTETVIGEGGYYDYPGMTIRWQKTAGSRWGSSPAMNQLSNIKSLNELQMMGLEATSKAIDPPMKATEEGVVGDLENYAGGLTIVTDINDLVPLVPATRFDRLDAGIARLQDMIAKALFVDRLDLPNARAMTATEVQIRYERILRLLAITMGRLKTDFLDPTIEGLVMKLIRYRQVKRMPESVATSDLDIEYTGPLPRALKGEIADGMERWLMGLIQQMEVNPSSLDIVEWDQFNRTMAEQRGVPTKVTKTEQEVQVVRKAREEDEAAANEAAKIQAGGEALEAAGKGAQAAQAAGGLEAVQ